MLENRLCGNVIGMLLTLLSILQIVDGLLFKEVFRLGYLRSLSSIILYTIAADLKYHENTKR